MGTTPRRSDRASEGQVMGTGLGPAIARHLTALMGGQAAV